jgi:hypothetical protein
MFGLLAAVCFVLLCLASPATSEVNKRLILKDGSWQEITKYEVVGDRTRYFSSQRLEWEEVPRELVDWKATKEWNARPMPIPPDEAEEDFDATSTLTVAPGLALPDSGGVFILDVFSGQPSLVELAQDPGVLNYDAASIFHSAIHSGGAFKQRFELRGQHARTQAHVALPQIFIKISESDQARQMASASRFSVVKLEPKKDSRILAGVDVTVTGKQSQTQHFIPVKIENFSEGWQKVIPLGELEPGEYALVEMLEQGKFNSYAWDFGVNPDAPANANSRKEASSEVDQTGASWHESEPPESKPHWFARNAPY